MIETLPIVCQNLNCEYHGKTAEAQHYEVLLEGAYLDGNLSQIDGWDIWHSFYEGGTFTIRCCGCQFTYEVTR